MAASSSLPVVDFSWLGTEREQDLLEIWDFAFRTYGFCILKNHGYNKEFEELEKEAIDFFELPLDAKCATSASGRHVNVSGNGYNGYGLASVSRTQGAFGKPRPGDAVESMLALDGNFSGFVKIIILSKCYHQLLNSSSDFLSLHH